MTNTFAVQLMDGARRLHKYLLDEHWNGRALVGPDSGVRLENRLGRFIKSYLPFIPWADDYIFQQCQGYWTLSNWLFDDLTGEGQFSSLALACSDAVMAGQRPEGYWEYPPVPSRKGKIATVEGDIAAIALLETYRRTQREELLVSAKRWHRYLTEHIGFQSGDGWAAVNYWAGSQGAPVPNNTTLTLWTYAKLAEATQDQTYLDQCQPMVAFLRRVQMENSELPYSVSNGDESNGRPHFLCYQYNAFEFLDLVYYHRLSGDDSVLPILRRLAAFLSSGVTESGAARHNCFQTTPEVPYYTAALAAALDQAVVLGLGDYRATADRAFARVLSWQRPEGGFQFFSRRNYGFLTDRRSYPRNLSMILYHMLSGYKIRAHPPGAGQTAQPVTGDIATE